MRRDASPNVTRRPLLRRPPRANVRSRRTLLYNCKEKKR